MHPIYLLGLKDTHNVFFVSNAKCKQTFLVCLQENATLYHINTSYLVSLIRSVLAVSPVSCFYAKLSYLATGCTFKSGIDLLISNSLQESILVYFPKCQTVSFKVYL